MRVIDLNIIIYASYPKNEYLRKFISEQPAVITTISIIETLGYHKITTEDTEKLQLIIDTATIVDLSREIVNLAIKLRLQKNIALADAIIAATALYYDFELATNNEDDFKGIDKLQLINPLKQIS